MSISLSRGPIAILNFADHKATFLTFAKAIHDAVDNNPAFPAPAPTMAQLAADLAALEEAETKAATKAKGTAAHRDAKKKKVMDDLRYLRDYVQGVADAQPNEADAIAVIKSALFEIRKQPVRSKPELEVRNNGAPGSVIAIAKAVGRTATYFWEHSLDQETWAAAPATMKAHTEIAGLASAETHAFRFRALTPKGTTEYSQVVTLLVH